MIASPRTIAVHVLRALAVSAEEGRRVDLAAVAAELGVRRADVRSALTALHREGYVDLTRMRPTLAGFAIGAALKGKALVPVRSAPVKHVVAA